MEGGFARNRPSSNYQKLTTCTVWPDQTPPREMSIVGKEGTMKTWRQVGRKEKVKQERGRRAMGLAKEGKEEIEDMGK